MSLGVRDEKEGLARDDISALSSPQPLVLPPFPGTTQTPRMPTPLAQMPLDKAVLLCLGWVHPCMWAEVLTRTELQGKRIPVGSRRAENTK